jgi:hypothetical protein
VCQPDKFRAGCNVRNPTQSTTAHLFPVLPPSLECASNLDQEQPRVLTHRRGPCIPLVSTLVQEAEPRT